MSSIFHNAILVAGVIAVGYCVFTVGNKVFNYSYRMEQKLDHVIVLSQVRIDNEFKSKKFKKQVVSENKTKTKKNIKKDQKLTKSYVAKNEFIDNLVKNVK